MTAGLAFAVGGIIALCVGIWKAERIKNANDVKRR